MEDTTTSELKEKIEQALCLGQPDLIKSFHSSDLTPDDLTLLVKPELYCCLAMLSYASLTQSSTIPEGLPGIEILRFLFVYANKRIIEWFKSVSFITDDHVFYFGKIESTQLIDMLDQYGYTPTEDEAIAIDIVSENPYKLTNSCR